MNRDDTMFDQNLIDRAKAGRASHAIAAGSVETGGEEEERVGEKDAARTQKERDAHEGGLTDDEALTESLEESMDASDPPSITQPGHNDPAPSSGFPEEKAAPTRH